MPFKVQSLLPSIGLELYQLGVHILAKKKKGQCLFDYVYVHFSVLYKNPNLWINLNDIWHGGAPQGW